MNSLEIRGLRAGIGAKEILTGVDLTVRPGEIHIVMGRNGSGKSTLANALIGKPGVEISAGSVQMDGRPLLQMPTQDRALAGLFVASQYPVEVPGLSNGQFLRSMANLRAAGDDRPSLGAAVFLSQAKECCRELGISPDFLQRSLNAGMSGGERKRNELLQLRFFNARYAFLDEIDSGLDVDAWGQAVDFIAKEQALKKFGLVLISHYSKMAERFPSAIVHLLDAGRIARSGGVDLARFVEDKGFEEALQ